jgi:hypothetical protein
MLLRCDPAEYERLLEQPGVEPFEMRGRGMAGWLHVDPAGMAESRLADWVARGVAYARSLPRK